MKLKNKLYKCLTKDYSDWEIDRYHAYHKKAQIKFWIANGFLYFNQDYGVNIKIGLINKIKLWNYLKYVKNKLILDKINNP